MSSDKQQNDDSKIWCSETGKLWTMCNCSTCTKRKQRPSEMNTVDEIPNENIDKERLWRDIKSFVEMRIDEGKTEMSTRSQKKRFWLISVSPSYTRIEREKSELPYEDIPKSDFIDIWIDLHKSKYNATGYSQKDLHGGQNRHTAVTFTLLSYISYIKERKDGRALKYFLKKHELK